MQQTAPAYLIIQLGNRWSDILRLHPDRSITVGRSSDCQIVVKDERVSRKHAEFTPQGGRWVVRDLGSRNGTQVDGLTIEDECPLVDGMSIDVGGCVMTFATRLGQGFPRQSGASSAPSDAVLADQQTEEIQPTIVNRIAGSPWAPRGSGAVRQRTAASSQRLPNSAQSTDQWGFFYRLISDLVAADAPEAAAQVALDRLVDRLELTFGGVVTMDEEGGSGDIPPMAVLATRQAAGGSYHRVSDFLVHTVIAERQALLARNVQDDSKLSVARASGQREIVSILCAPLKKADADGERVVGLLHVYTAGEERMLTEVDLELAVGVADNLAIALTRQRENAQLAKSLETSRRRADQLQAQLDQSSVMVGESTALQKVRKAIERAGPTDATILVRGESGVGKELVARAVHRASARRDGPLICLNCAALAPTLLESELFGHEKGAFTGATEKKTGKFEAADGGTLLLDEIAEMSPELQAKFLRVLEGHPFERLGGHRSIQTDVRVIAATNRDLEQAVQAKEFRADLYFRLRVIEIYVPPLRQRKDDIPRLVEHFVEQLKHHAGRRLTGIAPESLELLTRHEWPGNVRELRNVVERAIVLGGGATIEPEDLNLVRLDAPASAQDEPQSDRFRPVSLAELEKEHIFKMLEHTGGNKTKASQLLGIERSTLDRKLKKY